MNNPHKKKRVLKTKLNGKPDKKPLKKSDFNPKVLSTKELKSNRNSAYTYLIE